MRFNRLYIIGPEGCGKSTLASFLSKQLKIKHYDLDDIVWSRRYDKKRSYKNRLKNLNKIVKKDKWIIEGIFGGWTEPVFKKADFVIILNLNYHLLIKNLLKRFFIGRFRGYEKEKTNIYDTWKVIKHVKKYRIRNHPKSYSGHMELIKKYNKSFIEIRSNRQLKEFLKLWK
jgi:adenylate kinase family enzyme